MNQNPIDPAAILRKPPVLTMSAKHRDATSESVVRAYTKAANDMLKRPLTAKSVDAGFIKHPGLPKGESLQVFVRIVRFSEKKLKDYPMSGGLLAPC